MSATKILAALVLVGFASASPLPEQAAPQNEDIVITQHSPKGTPDCNGSSTDQDNFLIQYRTKGEFFTNWWGQISGCDQQVNYCLPWWTDVNYQDNTPDGIRPNVTYLAFDGNTQGLATVGKPFQNRVLNVFTTENCTGSVGQVYAGSMHEVNPARLFNSFAITDTQDAISKGPGDAKIAPLAFTIKQLP